MGDTFTLVLSEGVECTYVVVRSKKAKYVRIKISSDGELSITIPYSAKVSVAHDFIYSKKEWVEKNLLKVDRDTVDQLPGILDLKLLGEVWRVLYIEESDQKKASLVLRELETPNHQENTIEVRGNSVQLKDPFQVKKVLHQWCKKKAHRIFNSMLTCLAESYGFHYHNLTIRAQKTRWGSCSSKKNINLNCKLILMPKEIVEYVMIHELCHTIEMNHSSAFWALVEECDPSFRENKNKLKHLGFKIPI